jgi:hypothetical protein
MNTGGCLETDAPFFKSGMARKAAGFSQQVQGYLAREGNFYS